jgi:hypothetical protein
MIEAVLHLSTGDLCAETQAWLDQQLADDVPWAPKNTSEAREKFWTPLAHLPCAERLDAGVAEK